MSSRTRCFAPSAHSLKAEERNRAMLDKLPTELVLTIAELGAPQIAPDRKSLAIVRRRYFVSLAAVSRPLYAALRPYIWEHVQTKGEEIQTLVEKFARSALRRIRQGARLRRLLATSLRQALGAVPSLRQVDKSRNLWLARRHRAAATVHA
jgi:hypothetical protein